VPKRTVELSFVNKHHYIASLWCFTYIVALMFGMTLCIRVTLLHNLWLNEVKVWMGCGVSRSWKGIHRYIEVELADIKENLGKMLIKPTFSWTYLSSLSNISKLLKNWARIMKNLKCSFTVTVNKGNSFKASKMSTHPRKNALEVN
jgi:hypothetical protein